MIEVPGPPIGGENPPHDRAWRRRVAEVAAGQPPVAAVGLDFRLREGRRVDLDNLVRPAMAGLQDAGMFGRGYRSLELLVASKIVDHREGLWVEVGDEVVGSTAADRGRQLFSLAASAIPREGDRASKVGWRDAVRTGYAAPPVDGPVWVDIVTRTTGSLVALMKPVIDGLEPLLGRDPRGRLEFVPNDHLVERLTMRRDLDLPAAVVVAAGPLASG